MLAYTPIHPVKTGQPQFSIEYQVVRQKNVGSWRDARHRATCLPVGRSATSPTTQLLTHFGLFTSIPAAKFKEQSLLKGDKSNGNKVQANRHPDIKIYR
ncbi:MAG TPA: hypothetical protein VL728_18080 [Cyclobacteriaceae bacterium]|nr:hypothetical protein [Cyclobacteriaceae bacterium]